MENRLTNSVPELIEKSGVVVAGLTEYGATIGLVRHTAASTTQKVTDVIMAVGAVSQTKATQRNKRAALRLVTATARQFAMAARDSLKPVLGNMYSAAWNEVGFNGTLIVSLDPGELKVLMQAIKAYLTRYPAFENEQANVTAARAEVLYNDLTTAVDAVAVAKYNVATALRTRGTAVTALKGTIRGVISELSEEIDPLSDYWLRFGFNKPGAKQTPPAPQNVVATLSGNAAALDWPDAPRADHYRVWRKVVGVDQEMVAIGSPSDSDFTAQDLPANKTIEFAISAVNNGGESQLSGPITVVTQ